MAEIPEKVLGGGGGNLAIQDAIAATNILATPRVDALISWHHAIPACRSFPIGIGFCSEHVRT